MIERRGDEFFRDGTLVARSSNAGGAMGGVYDAEGNYLGEVRQKMSVGGPGYDAYLPGQTRPFYRQDVPHPFDGWELAVEALLRAARK